MTRTYVKVEVCPLGEPGIFVLFNDNKPTSVMCGQYRTFLSAKNPDKVICGRAPSDGDQECVYAKWTPFTSAEPRGSL